MWIKLKQYSWVYGVIASLSLIACSTQINPSNQLAQKREASLQEVSVDPTKVVMGQTVYVPIYSHIYHYNSQNQVMNLSATLSIRNTDLAHPIIVTSVRYYNTEGQLIRQDVERPVALKPLASTSFFVAADDTSGGAGANFIVEWVTEKSVSEPVIEAVMINSSSAQGISFITSGKVLQQRSRSN